MNWSCLLAPGDCIDSAMLSFIAWFPFGIEGMKAVAWMIVGAMLGKIGVGAVITLGGALKVANVDHHEHVAGKDAVPPVAKPRHRTVLLDEFKKLGK